MIVGQIEGLAGLPLDLSLYASLPTFTYLSIGTELRPTQDLIEEFLTRVTPSQKPERVWQMAFADHDIVRRFPAQFRAVLEKCIDHNCKVSFYALKPSSTRFGGRPGADVSALACRLQAARLCG